MKVALEDDPDDTVLREVLDGMRAFNKAAVPGLASHKIVAAIRDGDGALHGGVIGRLAGDSVYMEVVWNDDNVRGTGLGREMMTLVEERARELGAREAWLYTMSFQARPFYEKLGYSQFAELPWLKAAHAAFHAEGLVRITGGTFRGRALAAPTDSRVRPTSDKVRQAIFNILAHNDFGSGFTLEGARVADLFAGTGALGIEALSHGAVFCLLVDDSAESRALIRTNVEALNLTGVTKIWRRDATDLGPMAAGAGGPFDLVFLDPPYRKGFIAPALGALRAGGWLCANAVIVSETAADEDVPAAEAFKLLDQRDYGDTRVSFLTGL